MHLLYDTCHYTRISEIYFAQKKIFATNQKNVFFFGIVDD